MSRRATHVDIPRPEPVEPAVISRPAQAGVGPYRQRRSRLVRDLSAPSFHHDAYDYGNVNTDYDSYEQPDQQQQQQQQRRSTSRAPPRAISDGSASSSNNRRRSSYLDNGTNVGSHDYDAAKFCREPSQRLVQRERMVAEDYQPGGQSRLGSGRQQHGQQSQQYRRSPMMDSSSSSSISTMDASYMNSTSNRMSNNSSGRNYAPPPRIPSTGSAGSSRRRVPAAAAETTYVEIAPGVDAPLRNSDETMGAISRNFIVSALCFGCEASLYCIADAKFLICPQCRVVSPLLIENDDGSASGHGVGLGFTRETLLATQADAIVPTY